MLSILQNETGIIRKEKMRGMDRECRILWNFNWILPNSICQVHWYCEVVCYFAQHHVTLCVLKNSVLDETTYMVFDITDKRKLLGVT